MSDEARNPRSVRRPVIAGALTTTPVPWPFKPNWISFRRSLVLVDRRTDAGETVQLCGMCGCEVDVTPVPHSPRCKTLEAA